MLTWENLWSTPLKRKLAVRRAQKLQAEAVMEALGEGVIGNRRGWGPTEEIAAYLRDTQDGFKDVKDAAMLVERLGVKLDIPEHILNEARRIEAVEWNAPSGWRDNDTGRHYFYDLDESQLEPRERPAEKE